MDKVVIAKLLELANALDAKGYMIEANQVDRIIKKATLKEWFKYAAAPDIQNTVDRITKELQNNPEVSPEELSDWKQKTAPITVTKEKLLELHFSPIVEDIMLDIGETTSIFDPGSLAPRLAPPAKTFPKPPPRGPLKPSNEQTDYLYKD